MTMGRNVMAASLIAATCLAIGAIGVGTAAARTASGATAKSAAGGRLVDRGRYRAKIAGCNDCHTPGHMAKNGKVPEAQ